MDEEGSGACVVLVMVPPASERLRRNIRGWQAGRDSARPRVPLKGRGEQALARDPPPVRRGCAAFQSSPRGERVSPWDRERFQSRPTDPARPHVSRFVGSATRLSQGAGRLAVRYGRAWRFSWQSLQAVGRCERPRVLGASSVIAVESRSGVGGVSRPARALNQTTFPRGNSRVCGVSRAGIRTTDRCRRMRRCACPFRKGEGGVSHGSDSSRT